MPVTFGLLLELMTSRYMKRYSFFLVPLLMIICCSDITIHDRYDFSKPSEIVELPPELLEVSGISHISDDLIACVMDEDAVIFFFDIAQKKITSTFRFGPKGDYEDLVVTDDYVFVLKSDGNLFRVNMKQGTDNRQEFNTGLSANYDTEGLCYDKNNNRLLIACKSGGGKKGKGDKVIYAFDLKTESLSNEPVIIFSKDEIDKFITKHSKELPQSIVSLKNEKKMDHLLSPSGIAIHPKTEQLYVLSSRSGLLLVSDLQGKILNMVSLPKDIFNQPEGITFTPEAKLYISNEGKKNPATIVGFN